MCNPEVDASLKSSYWAHNAWCNSKASDWCASCESVLSSPARLGRFDSSTARILGPVVHLLHVLEAC